jgi:hypothetical protein
MDIVASTVLPFSPAKTLVCDSRRFEKYTRRLGGKPHMGYGIMEGWNATGKD